MVRLGSLKLVVCFLVFAVTTLPASILSAQELTVKYAAEDFKGPPKFTVKAFKNGSFRAVWRSKTITAEGGLDTARYGQDRNRLKWQNVSFQIPPNLGIEYFTIRFLNDACCGATKGGKKYGDRNLFVQKITFNRKVYFASRGKQKTCRDSTDKAGEMHCEGTLEIAVANNTGSDTNATAASIAPLSKSVCGYNFREGKSRSDLKSIQRGLAKRNLYNGGIDGKFGKGSCSALEKWAKCENVGSKVLSGGALSKLTDTNPSARELSCYGIKPPPLNGPKILSVNSSDNYRTHRGKHTIINVEMRNRWGNRADFKLNGYVTDTKPNGVCLVYGNRNSDNKCFGVYDSNNTIKQTIAKFNKRDKENITDACALIVTQFNKIRQKTKNINSRKLVDQRKSAFTGFAYKCLAAIQSSFPGTRYAAASAGLVAPTLEGPSTPDQVASGASCKQSKLQIRFNQNVLKSLDLYTSTVDGIEGPNYRKAVAGGEKIIGQWADAKKDCLGVIERKILEAVVAARKRGSSCEYLPNSTEIKNRFNGLKSKGLTEKAKLDHEKASGLIWMIETVSELEMRLSFLNFYSSRNSSMRDCRLSNKELGALETKPVESKPVVVAKAPTCEDDPALCSIVQLCGKAASTVNGDRAWNTDAKAADYVALAKSSGVTCGVKPKPVVVAKAPTCEDDPALCSIVQLCGKAASTVNGDRAWNTDAKAADYVALAKSSGVTCGVKPKPVVVAKAPTCEDDPALCSIVQLCGKAASTVNGDRAWNTDAKAADYVALAKSSGVTCGVKPKPVVVAKAPTCEDDPALCSIVQLCGKAASTVNGDRAWNTDAKAADYVALAKSSGVTCGVKPKPVVVAKAPTCEDDPALCSIVQLCGKAASTVNGDRAWNTDAKAADYVALAKSSGVTCGVKPKPVVVAKAPTCEDDPALCSIVQLCGKAASTVNGDRAWNTDAKAADYVALAKSSGVTCGVKPKPIVVAKAPTCEDDPTKCSVIELCQQATGTNTSGEKFWRMDAALQAYVDTAKSTGVTCGVVSKVIETAKLETCENTPSKCSLAELCQRAISFETGKLGWTTTINGAPYVQFAKNSGMTCGVQENLVAAVPEQKQVEPPAPKKVLKYTNRKALVIGNANYVDQTPLKNPINDAKAVAAKLEQIGFEVTYKENLEYREFGRTLGDFEREVASSDISLIYYAGHGIEVDSVNYLIPVDAELSNPSDVKFETVMLEDAVRASLNTGKLSMVMVDACRDNPFAKSMTGGSRSVGRGLSIVDAQPGKIDQIISFAAESGEVAEDGTGNNSPYATALLQLLDEPNLEVGKLFRKLGDNVERMTNGKQIPVTRNRLSGEDIYLVME